MGRRKIRKSVWMPWALAVYSAGMYAWFIPRGNASPTEIAVTVGLNAVVIVLLWLLYRKKEQLEARREDGLDERRARENGK
ncbi:MAG: hypothetical protein NC388_07645 [Clostridium sp.]|nr:hypothetical protein [Clostridium sp.]